MKVDVWIWDSSQRREGAQIDKSLGLNSQDTMAQLKYYFDIMSQPSRAVYMFLKVNRIPFEEKPVALRKGEHLSPEFAKINPFQRVPVIDDNGFILTESIAILHYLADKYPTVADHWYPKDRKLRARVDEYTSWQHLSTRMNAAMFFRALVIEPRMKNIPVDQERVRRFRAELQTTLDQIEQVFLKDQDFLAGKEISIADLLGVCELMQPLAAGYDVTEDRPVLAAWVERVKERLQPHFDESHVLVKRVRERFLEGRL